MNLLEALINSFRLPELRNKILFTGGILIVFRLFANIAIPEANKTALGLLFNQQALLGLLDLFSGGGLSRFSVVAMGMNPYINATIIMQLMTVISERIKEIQKEGEMGRRRIQRWSRYLTVALGAAGRGRARGGTEGQLPAAACQPRGRDSDHLCDLGDVPADDHRQLLQRRSAEHVVLPRGSLDPGQLRARYLEPPDGDHLQRPLLPVHVRVHVLLHGHHI